MFKSRSKIILSVLALIVAGIVLYLGINSYTMDRMVAQEVETLIQDSTQVSAPAFSYADLEGLPAPVQRYFRYALPENQKTILYAKINIESEYKSPAFGNFGAFNATEHLMAFRPGLIFDAVMWPVSMVWMDVRDKYYNGHAGMQINMFSGFNIMTEAQIPELDITTLIRWAGEAILTPTALLPNEFVQWQAVDENHAIALITDGDKTGQILFTFNELGQITSYSSNDRFDRVDDVYTPSASLTYRDQYQEFDHIRIPTEFRVIKILNGVEEEYFRGKIVNIEFVTEK